jgi:hypothetical protein
MIKQKLKKWTPRTIWDAASETRYALNRAAQWPSARFHPLRRESIKRLADYQDIHRGQRCFIIGNGPSLKNTDMTHLKGEFTFGMNRIYLMFPELGFTTTYYACINSMVIEQCAQDIRELEIPRFLSWRSHDLVADKTDELYPPDVHNPPHKDKTDLIFLHTTYTGPGFSKDARRRLWEGATVTYVTLQLAYFMGFEKVILIGVDHNYATKGKPNTTVVSQGDDPNHFNANYFGKGFQWQLPDLDTNEKAYRMARNAYEADGRQVIDATVGGKLMVFPKVEYDTLF